MPKIKPLVVCIESHFSSALPGGSSLFASGSRLEADHPAVKMNPQYFADSGLPHDELDRRRRALHVGTPVPADPVTFTRILERRLRDSDAVVAIRGGYHEGVGFNEGDRLGKRDSIVKANKDAFVPVLPKGVARTDCVLALAAVHTTLADDTVRIVYRGQLVPRDHPDVQLHPHQFAVPAIEA